MGIDVVVVLYVVFVVGEGVQVLWGELECVYFEVF